MDQISRVEDCYCFATRQAARFISQIYERHFEGTDITAPQFTILILLYRHPDATTSALANAMVMDRTTMVRAIAPLQRSGLVVAESKTPKSRIMQFRLTDAGLRKVAEDFPRWEAAQLEYEGRVGAPRAQQLRQELLELTV